MLFSFELPLDATPKFPEPAQTAFCPVCNGKVRELRGMVQCQRCQFIYCQGCEAYNSPIMDASENW